MHDNHLGELIFRPWERRSSENLRKLIGILRGNSLCPNQWSAINLRLMYNFFLVSVNKQVLCWAVLNPDRELSCDFTEEFLIQLHYISSSLCFRGWRNYFRGEWRRSNCKNQVQNEPCVMNFKGYCRWKLYIDSYPVLLVMISVRYCSIACRWLADFLLPFYLGVL